MGIGLIYGKLFFTQGFWVGLSSYSSLREKIYFFIDLHYFVQAYCPNWLLVLYENLAKINVEQELKYNTYASWLTIAVFALFGLLQDDFNRQLLPCRIQSNK